MKTILLTMWSLLCLVACGQKTTDLTPGTTTATADLFRFVDVSDTAMAGTGTNKSITWANLVAEMMEDITASATYQPLDADLTIYAGITPSANVQSLLGAANYAGMRSLLNLETGTDLQGYDDALTDLAAVNASADALSLLGAANYAGMRSLLNLETGTDLQGYDDALTDLAAVNASADALSLLGAANYAAMRGLLELEAVHDAGVIGLTGGGATKLDGITTVGVAAGRLQLVRASNKLYYYTLTSSTAAESVPYRIRPNDYTISTNEKVWELQRAATGEIDAYGKISVIGSQEAITIIPDPDGASLSVNIYAPASPADDRDIIIPDANGTLVLGNSSTSAPASTPDILGMFHLNTTSKVIYVSVGTASAADWIPFATTLGHPIGWNATQSKFQKITITGAAASETLTVSDL